MAQRYIVMNADGVEAAGDPTLDDVLRATADDLGGYITDETGTVVYDAREES